MCVPANVPEKIFIKVKLEVEQSGVAQGSIFTVTEGRVHDHLEIFGKNNLRSPKIEWFKQQLFKNCNVQAFKAKSIYFWTPAMH